MQQYLRWARTLGLSILSPLLAAILLTGCGGRRAMPVPEQTALDDRLSCEHLQGEYANNIARIADLQRERSRAQRDNVALALAGPPLMIDLSDTEQRETEALMRRNARVRDMAQQRGCHLPPPPAALSVSP